MFAPMVLKHDLHFHGVIVRSEKLQNESFPNFSNFRPEFCPEFCSEFSPNFSRTFRASFLGDRDQKKFTKNPRHFSIQNSQANAKKIFTKFFWRAGKVSNWFGHAGGLRGHIDNAVSRSSGRVAVSVQGRRVHEQGQNDLIRQSMRAVPARLTSNSRRGFYTQFWGQFCDPAPVGPRKYGKKSPKNDQQVLNVGA